MGDSVPLLAVDIGTSSVRAALFDGGARRMPETLTQRTYRLRTGLDGEAELDPHDLLRQVRGCLRGATRGWRKISGVGVSCFWHSLMGVDAEGNALTPIYTWADSRCRGDAKKLRETMDERAVHARTGCMVRTSFWPAKLAWLRRTDRARFRRVRKWVSPADWVQWRLTGTISTAVGMATGTGLFDPNTCDWDDHLLEVCHVGRERLAAITNEPSDWRGVPWFPAIGDGAASNLGCGAVSAGVGAINVGTSAALRVMRSGPSVSAPFGLFAYRVDRRRYLLGGAVSNAGNLHAWCVQTLRLPDDGAALERELASRTLPAHGLTVLPYWTAERAPTWNEDDRGVIHGLTQATSPTDILQAVTEGFYFRMADIAARIPGRITWVVSGGILQSPSALERMASVFGTTLLRSVEPEASLRGAAVYALEQLGSKIPPLEHGEPVRPNPVAHTAYRAERVRQLALEKALKNDTGR